MRIKLSYSFVTEPLLRQTPGGAGIWKGSRFFPNDPDVDECDYWVVLEDPPGEERALVRSGRTVLLTLEPRGADGYRRDYLAQFDLVISAYPDLDHPNVRVGQGPTWHIGMYKGTDSVDRSVFHGRLSYDDFIDMPMPEKTGAVSVVCATTTETPGHRLRWEFTQMLMERLGDRIDVFGQGVRFTPDKAEAILPYRYHVPLENSYVRNYWTEKIADSYLGWSFPLYWGCENIADYFPKDSFIPIDLRKMDEAIAIVESAMDKELTPEQVAGLAAARAQVLDRYNTFDVVSRACKSLTLAKPRSVTIRNQRFFRKSRSRRALKVLTASIARRSGRR